MAGAGIADGRWSDQRKKIIMDSRVESAKLIRSKLESIDHNVRSFISASAVGYYGTITSDKIFDETDPAGSDFLAEVCQKWEAEAQLFSSLLGIRSVSIRTGVVLDADSKIIKNAVLPTKMGLAAPLGKGSQYMPWIHLHDLCRIYLKAIEDDTLTGAYNAVAPEAVTNKQFMKETAQTLHKPMFKPAVPAFVFKLFLGESAQIILEESRASSVKIQKEGFSFEYPTLSEALHEILL